MVKLHKLSDDSKSYWETWDNGGVHAVHWGELGTKGDSKELKSSFLRKATAAIQKEIDQRISEGYSPVDLVDCYTRISYENQEG